MIRGVTGPLILALVCLALAMPGRTADAGDDTQLWGDTDCGGFFNIGDAINHARNAISLPFNAQPDCPSLGEIVIVDGEERKWGDTDCGGAINIGDAINTSRKLVNLPVNSQPGCPTLGTEVLLGAAGIVMDGTVPSSIHGEEMTVVHSTGDDMVDADPTWTDWFPEIGAEEGSFELSTSSPKAGSSLDFSMITITSTNDGFDPGLTDGLFIAIQDHPESGYVAEEVTLGGIFAHKFTVPGDPNYSATYYRGVGDTLYIITSGDEALVAEVLAALPAPSAARSGDPRAVPQGNGDYVPGSTLVIPRLVWPVAQPVCVGEPFGRVVIQVMALDAVYQVPVPAFYSVNNVQRGEVAPNVAYGGAALLNYKATSFDSMEHITIQAVSPFGGNGIGTIDFPIRHCLNGTWQDDERVLQINHFGSSVTANIQSGTLCDESGGVAFSGSLDASSTSFSGSDLKVCNPDACVEGGFLPASTTADYSAMVSSDGNSVDFNWSAAQFDLTYEDDVLVSCVGNGDLEPMSFSISRITFGPGVP